MKDPVKDMRLALYPLGDITQWFGENEKLYSKMGLKAHNGIDIVRPWGEHLFAIEGGVVCDLKNDPSGYGMHVRILSFKGHTGHEWTYGHMSHINVTLGQVVKDGQYIGNIGNTGFVVSNATGNGYWDVNPYAGTHLHLGLRVVRKDPNGWKYPGVNTLVRVEDYNNGFKGAIDPVQYFLPKKLKSSILIRVASVRNSKLLLDAGYLMKRIGL